MTKSSQHASSNPHANIELIERLFNLSPALIVAYDIHSGEYIYANDGAQLMLGYPKAKILKDGLAFVASLVHPDDAGRIMTENNAALQEANKKQNRKGPDKVVAFEYRMKHRDGTWRWVHSDGIVFERDKKGLVSHVMNITVDITERKQAEEAAREAVLLEAAERQKSEEKLKLSLRAGRMGTWEWNVVTGELIWSDDMKRLYGLSTEVNLTYEIASELHHPDDKKRVNKLIESALKSGKSYQVEYRVIWPDKSIHWVQSRGRALLVNGKPVRMIGMLMNIDERKANEDKVSRSEVKFRELFENAPEAIFIYTRNALILDANVAACKLLGYSKKRIIKLPMSDFLKPKDVKLLTGASDRTVNSNDYYGELELRSNNGQAIEAEITARQLPDGSWLAFARDITERNKYTEEIQKARVNEKVLAEKATLLKQQHEQLLVLNKAKDEFISVASHHLRTPASAVKMYLGLLKEGYAGNLTTEQSEFLNQAFESNEQQLQVIDDILNVAEMDAERVQLRRTSVDIAQLTREVMTSLSYKFRSRKQKLSFSDPDQKLIAKLDSAKMRLVLENIIGNASKYTPEGKKIDISIKKVGKMLQIQVHDEGKGIDPGEMDKIFDKFARVRNEAYISESGTGLGLYWAKRIVEMHNGEIKVASKPGKGTTVTVTLPIK